MSLTVHLICGSRTTSRYQEVVIGRELDELGLEFVATGDCRTGVDRHVDWWARRHAVPRLLLSADWGIGRPGGPKRNRLLRDLCIDLFLRNVVCVAFPGGSGTANMVAACQASGLPIIFKTYPKV